MCVFLLETLSGGSDIHYHQFLVLGVASLSVINNLDRRKVPTAFGRSFLYCLHVCKREREVCHCHYIPVAGVVLMMMIATVIKQQ